MKWHIFLVLILVLIPNVLAVDFDTEPTEEDKAKFDKILEPVTKIYSLAKYTATAIATMVLLFAGISFITSAGDPKKRDTAKHMATYVIVGLIVIWAAPFVVNLVVA